MAVSGFLLIDKPTGITSFDVVRDVKRSRGEKKVGHSGTLDPLATGLMLVALGEATKLLEYLIGCNKEYVVKAEFGRVSDSYDRDGQISDGDGSLTFTKEEVQESLQANFSGKISQMPPKYSALKIGGKRACDLMREGKEVELKAREVEIFESEIVAFDWPFVDIRVACGAGTYIRSLVHDLGQKLGCGAYVKELRRTKIGEFSIEEVSEELISLEDLCRRCFECKELGDTEWIGLQDGKVLPCESVVQKKCSEGVVIAFYEGKVVGVLETANGGVKFRKRIFSP